MVGRFVTLESMLTIRITRLPHIDPLLCPSMAPGLRPSADNRNQGPHRQLVQAHQGIHRVGDILRFNRQASCINHIPSRMTTPLQQAPREATGRFPSPTSLETGLRRLPKQRSHRVIHPQPFDLNPTVSRQMQPLNWRRPSCARYGKHSRFWIETTTAW